MDTNAIESLYDRHCRVPHGTNPHLPTLREYASRCDVAIEFGCKQGRSATAIILGARQCAISYDIEPTRHAKDLQKFAGDKWLYILADTRTADVPECDMLFVDSLHTYAQVDAELKAHADKVKRWLLFHDTLTFSSIGADGETGKHSWTPQANVSVPMEHMGIRPAIDELMIRDPSWRIIDHKLYGHGLLILERQS